MALHIDMVRAPSARRLMRYVTVVAVLLLGFSAPARADVIVVENAEQLEYFKRLWSAAQDHYLKASRAMEPCYQNHHGRCQQEMRQAIVSLPSAVMVAGSGVTEYLPPIRNNAFRYERVFSLLFLNAVVQGNRGAGCGVFAAEAARPLAGGAARTLAEHLSQAELEVGNRRHLPEYEMLERVRSVVGPCVGRA